MARKMCLTLPIRTHYCSVLLKSAEISYWKRSFEYVVVLDIPKSCKRLNQVLFPTRLCFPCDRHASKANTFFRPYISRNEHSFKMLYWHGEHIRVLSDDARYTEWKCVVYYTDSQHTDRHFRSVAEIRFGYKQPLSISVEQLISKINRYPKQATTYLDIKD